MASLFCKGDAVDEISAVDIGSIRLAAISVVDDATSHVKRFDPGVCPPVVSMCLLSRDLESGISIREALNKLDDYAIKSLLEKFRAQRINIGVTFCERMDYNKKTEYLDLAEAEKLIHDLLTSSWDGREIRLQISRVD